MVVMGGWGMNRISLGILQTQVNQRKVERHGAKERGTGGFCGDEN
jgi:hypothetical protein